MFVRQSDRELLAAARAAATSLGRVPLTAHAADLRDISVTLLEEIVADFGALVSDLDAEAVEASEAHAVLQDAGQELRYSFGDLYDGLMITYRHRRLGQRGRADDHTETLDRYLDGVNPSSFGRLGRATRLTIMDKALSYLDRYMVDGLVPQPVVDGAEQARDAFADALTAHAEEDADVTDKRNVVDAHRSHAEDKYIAARQAADAALRLGEVHRPVSEYLPSLRAIFAPGDSSTADADGAATDTDSPTQPTDAADPATPSVD